MLRRNIFHSTRIQLSNAHDGEGYIEFCRVFFASDFVSSIDFIDYAIVPPGNSIGYHEHQENEEVYVVLRGYGEMRVGIVEANVEPGDVIVNPSCSYHGLRNGGTEDIHLLVFQVSICPKEEKK